MKRKRIFKGLSVALGAAIGAVAGAIAGNMGVWLAIGVAIGIAIGMSVRNKPTDCPECAVLHPAHGAARDPGSPQ